MTKTAAFTSVVATGVLLTGLFMGAVTVLASEGEGGRHTHPHRVPLSGEIVTIDDDSVTITLSDNFEVPEHLADKSDLEAGDEVTFVINERTRMHSQDGESFESGDTVYVAVFRHDDQAYARAISDQLPNIGHHFVGAVISIDTDANEIVVEKRDGTQETVVYTDDTKFLEDKEEVAESSVDVGDHLVMRGFTERAQEAGKDMVIKILEPIDWEDKVE